MINSKIGPSSKENSDIEIWRWERLPRTGIIIEGFLKDDRWSQERYGMDMGKQREHARGCTFLAEGHVGKGGKPGLEGLELLAWRVWTCCSLLAYDTAPQKAGPVTQLLWHPVSPPGESLRVPSQLWCSLLLECLQFPQCVCLNLEPLMPSTIKNMVVEFLLVASEGNPTNS